jgi:hypothetical protein
VRALAVNAIEASFLPAADREAAMREVEQGWAAQPEAVVARGRASFSST